jgi:tRNA (guanine37-N1)-methyltransferase
MAMHIDIISAVPELLDSFFLHSIVQRASEKQIATVRIIALRDYALLNKQRQIDDYPYGGGAGMVLRIEPVYNCIAALKQERAYDEVIYTSPDGEPLTQRRCNQLSTLQNIIILCGHYKGIDERIREHLITREISIGDYVMSGGELAAAVISDSIIRLIPGVLGDEQSALSDSFQDDLIAPPVYTRPAAFNTWTVPNVLLSGHAADIEQWRMAQSIERTRLRRPHLLKK